MQISKTTLKHLQNLRQKADLVQPFNGRVQVSEAEHKAMQRALNALLASGQVIPAHLRDAIARLGLKIS